MRIDTLRLDADHNGLGHRGMTPAQLAAAGVPDDVVLAAVKRQFGAMVDATAEQLRLRLITPGSGQAMEYAEAQAQAVAALAQPSTATPDLYPMLAASIGLDPDPQTGAPATDVLGAARAVIAARDGWKAAGAAIRRARLATKAAIEATATPGEAEAALAAAVWPNLH